MKIIESPQAPEALGPYSQAIISKGFVFCSGQIGISRESGNLQEGLEAQAKQALQNIDYLLEAAGSNKKQIIKTTIFLKNIGDYATVNTIYGDWLKGSRPARSTVEVARLPKDALIEFEVVAEA